MEVSYSGYTGRTSTKTNTYFPKWNEEITFTEKFPPLCKRIAISVCDFGLKNEIIATHFVHLNQIMDSSPDEDGVT